jgi:hypothetical protein
MLTFTYTDVPFGRIRKYVVNIHKSCKILISKIKTSTRGKFLNSFSPYVQKNSRLANVGT